MRNSTVSILPAKSLTATETGAAVEVSDFVGLVDFIFTASATGGSGQTATAKVQHSDDGSTNWADVVAFDAVTNAAASLQVKRVSADQLKKYVRGVDTLAGTDPTVAHAMVMTGRKAYA